VAPLIACAVLLALPAAAATPPTQHASAGIGPALVRSVIAGGGGRSAGDGYAISGTIGQPDADPLHPASAGAFALRGGFWPGLVQPPPIVDPVFLDGFEPAAH
jgi:hypothetical protein